MESIINENLDDEHDCDQESNEMSSADKTVQPNQNSVVKNAQSTEEEEDEDGKTNLLYPYNSINSSHNHHGNDDDDDCNSSEDTKTSCPRECVSLKTEQQQQVPRFHIIHL